MKFILANLALLCALLLIARCAEDERFVKVKCFDYYGAEAPCAP